MVLHAQDFMHKNYNLQWPGGLNSELRGYGFESFRYFFVGRGEETMPP